MAAPLLWLLLCLGSPFTSSFVIDTEQPIIFQDPDRSFGLQVAQIPGGVIVSAPLHQDTANKTGQLYLCDPRSDTCRPISIPVSADDVNVSLGLSLAVQSNPTELLVCGPTLQRTCGKNMYVNGRCYRLDNQLRVQDILPHSLPECNVRSLDIVFLVDGSGSVRRADFTKMLTFVTKIMETFKETDTQFALMQYSSIFEIHFDFKSYAALRDAKALIENVAQQFGGTLTSTAIQKVMEELFVPRSGHRAGSQRLLIVITDGETVGDRVPFSVSIAEAEKLEVLRYAIGVGKSFDSERAFEELKTIASKPHEDYVFRVTDFSALEQIQGKLQDKIFTIEGTQQQNGSSFQLEMSQEGFSSILTKEGAMLGAVGAYDWSGGSSASKSGEQGSVWINSTHTSTDMKDSYLGYSLHQVNENMIALGAPRYQHKGSVLLFKRNMKTSEWHQVATAKGDKIGSYFGSALSVSHEKSDRALLLIGAPTYYSAEAAGGRVYLCPLRNKMLASEDRRSPPVTLYCPSTLQGDASQSFGNFGSTISLLPDLTGDQIPDLAVGAPGEDQNKGAIYIFKGQPGGFRSSYIQRIPSSMLTAGLMSFGRSVSGNLDMTGDGLPDITVGSEGRVFTLRSLPVLNVSVSMSFSPPEILLQYFDCPNPTDQGTATMLSVCVDYIVRSQGATGAVPVQLSYTLLLDPGRTQTRAVFNRAERSLEGMLQLTGRGLCQEHSIRVPECVQDSLSPLRVSFNFSIISKSVLSEDSPSSHYGQVPFQQDCGSDSVCEDDLRVTSSFLGLSQLVVGLSLEVNVTVTVQNLGEDSYNTRTLISYPAGLSYRRVFLIQSNRLPMTVSCSAPDSQRQLICGINNPLLRPNSTVIFVVSFHVSAMAALGDTLSVTANITSDNGGAPRDLMTSRADLRVLYGIYVTVRSLEISTKYLNFSSSGSSERSASVEHVYRVINLGQHSLPLDIIFMVPVRLKEFPVWEELRITSSEPELTSCINTGETSGAENYRERLRSRPVLDCTVTTCVRYQCNIRVLDIQNSTDFTITGLVKGNWIIETELQKVSLESAAEILYNSSIYQHTLGQDERFIKAQTQTILEVYTQYNYVPVIVGSSVGGLVFLALLVAALYKLGFFKRQYKDMMTTPEGESAPEIQGTPE